LKLLFDTSVWVEHLRRNALAGLLPALRGKFWLWLDAVAAAELGAGCRNSRERRVVAALTEPFRRAGRILTPGQSDFERAGRTLSHLRERDVELKKPGAALLDGLIAAVAVREGCLLVTSNIDDFRKLASAIPLRVESLVEFRRRVSPSLPP